MSERKGQPDDPGVELRVVHLSSVTSLLQALGAGFVFLVTVIGGGAWYLADQAREQTVLADAVKVDQKRFEAHVIHDDSLYTNVLAQLTLLREGQVRVETKLDAAVQLPTSPRK